MLWRFEVQEALRNMGVPVNAYIKSEIFHHGDLTTKRAVLDALTNLEGKPSIWVSILAARMRVGE